jgi:mono/diheme cytochrome c family protein
LIIACVMDQEIVPQPIQSFFGILGSLAVFSLIVMYARLGAVQDGPAALAGESQGTQPSAVAQTAEIAAAHPVQSTMNLGAVEDFIASHADAMQSAELLYTSFCASCHGAFGEPRSNLMLGSDLFDGVFAYSSTPEAMSDMIGQGLIEKGMTPMKGLLDNDQIASIAAYVLSKQPGR